MTCFLVLSTRFLDDRYHGLTVHGERAEWPPSPFRLFQALVAAYLLRGSVLPKSIGDALRGSKASIHRSSFRPMHRKVWNG